MAPRSDPPPPKDHGPHTLRVRRGEIVGIFGDDVFVELGPRMQGFLSLRQFAEASRPPRTPGTPRTPRTPRIGEVYEFTLRGQEENLWALALREEPGLATWEDMEQGSWVQARVLRLQSGGLQLKIGPLHAFMPRSQTGLPRGRDAKVMVGKTITCEVIEIDRERQRVVVSRKAVEKRERESLRERRAATLKVGQVVQGRVTRIEPYGAFVAFGRGMEGLIHVSNLAHERVDHPTDVVELGESLEAKVLYVRNGGSRIGLGLKQMHEDPWRVVERLHYEGQIVEGTVTVVTGYGAFVAVSPGVEGLLHRSECGLDPRRRLEDELRPGQRLSVRILALDCERKRMSMSRFHVGGARIGVDEAASQDAFEELWTDGRDGALSRKLGSLLRRAMEEGAA